MGSGNEVALITNKLLQKKAEISEAKVLAILTVILCLPGSAQATDLHVCAA